MVAVPRPKSRAWPPCEGDESAGALARICGPVMAGPVFAYVHPGAPMLLGAMFGLANLWLLAGLLKELRERGVR